MAPHSEQKLTPCGRAFAVPLYQTIRKSMFRWLCVDLPQLINMQGAGVLEGWPCGQQSQTEKHQEEQTKSQSKTMVFTVYKWLNSKQAPKTNNPSKLSSLYSHLYFVLGYRRPQS